MTQKTVLLIDDDQSLRRSVRAFLEDDDFVVREAPDGESGIAAFHQDPPDLVIVDLKMPGISGLEVIERLTADAPGMPIITLSGTGLISDAIKAIRRGAWDFIAKPIADMEQLQHVVANVLERARLRQEHQHYQSHLEQEVARRTRELTELNDRLNVMTGSARAIAACSKWPDTAVRLLKEFASNMAAEGGSLYLVENDKLVLKHCLDPGHASESIDFPIDDNSAIGQALQSKAPVFIRSMEGESELASSGWKGYSDGSLLAFPFLNEEGDPLGVIALHNKKYPPFTEQDLEIGKLLAMHSSEAIRATRALEALREGEERLRNIAANLPGVVYQFYVTRDGLFHLNYISERTSEVLGLSPDLNGYMRAFYECIPEADRRRLIDSIKAAVANSAVWDYEGSFIKPSGKLLWLHGFSSPIRQEGRTLFNGVLLDMTERKEMEVQLRQAQKMEAIGTLAGGIAHDFNNILGAINGYTEIVMDQVRNGEAPNWTFLEQVLKASERARELVNQILTFSRRSEQEKRPLSVSLIVKEALKLLRGALPSSIDIRRAINTTSDVVLADPTQIHQVVMNLCTNAFHAMPDGGRLTVSLDELEIGPDEHDRYPEAAPGAYVRLSVADTGCGIPPEIISRIFDPFFTTRERGEGTGMGLAVVHGIAKAHGGAVLVQSEPERGSVFQVLLPRAEADEILEESATGPLPRGTETVLVVDDEEALCDIAAEILTTLGYNVMTQTSSVEASQFAQQCERLPDVVITDLTMPQISGIQLTETLRNRCSTLPVILWTGYGERVSAEQSAKAGFSKVLKKPVSKMDLANAVRQALDDAAK